MKFIFLLLTFFFVSSQVSVTGQNFPNRVTAPLSSPPRENNDDIQSRFMNQEWSPGFVQFKSSRPVMQVPLIFDADNNMLYYQQGGVIMEFVDSIYQFSMQLVRNNDSNFAFFRNSYPNIQSNTGQTFYEVIVDGNIQLLKCRAKTIYMFKEPDILDKKRPLHKELLFAFLPGNKIVVIKKDIGDIVAKMPEYAQRIKEIADKYKLKVRSEGKLRELFFRLNEPVK